jgi:hypothetical protein
MITKENQKRLILIQEFFQNLGEIEGLETRNRRILELLDRKEPEPDEEEEEESDEEDDEEQEDEDVEIDVLIDSEPPAAQPEGGLQ